MIAGAFIKSVVLRKMQEPTTWAGIVMFIAGALGLNVSPEMRDQIVAVVLPIVSLCLMLANERKGPNPDNAPLPPQGTVPVVTPVPATGAPAVVVHEPSGTPSGSASAGVAMPPVPRSDLPPNQRGNDASPPRPVRPGFNRYP